MIYCIFSCLALITGQAEPPDQAEDPPTVFDTPVNFSGWYGKTCAVKEFQEIRIGFFGPDDQDNPVGIHMVRGAELAIEEANRLNEFKEVPFKLIRRWSSDPWGRGSKEMIKLAYQDSVWAIIGSINGETTHIAEQIVTKAHVPLLTPVSADPTLTYIRIPWIFRLPPDDKKQAEIILKQGINSLALKKMGLITSTDHDGRIFGQEMLLQLESERLSLAFHFQVPPTNVNTKKLIHKIKTFHPEGIIIRLPLKETIKCLQAFQNNAFMIPIFIPWIPGFDREQISQCNQNLIYFVQPFSKNRNSNYHEFALKFKKQYGFMPGASSAFAYDAVNLVIKAIRSCGLNRARLRDTIFNMNNFHGVSAKVSWDPVGGNRIEPILNTPETNRFNTQRRTLR